MIVTTWGYSMLSVDKIPDLLTEEDFNVFTAKKFAGDARIAPIIKAADSAIRNYVGWHLSDSQECEVEYTFLNNPHISVVDHDMMIQLPTRFMTKVSKVIIKAVRDQDGNWTGNETSNFSFETDGTLWIYDFDPYELERYSKIVIDFTSGLPEAQMDGIKELVAHRVTHALVQPNGVQSEATGGVSVTYNATWVNNARATALPDDNKEVLEPYRLQGVF